MKISFVPSLCHLTCSRIVALICNHLEAQKDFTELKYETIRCQVKDAVLRVAPFKQLQEKLEVYIDPLLGEISKWSTFCMPVSYFYDFSDAILETIPRCWLSNGTIDREKSVRMLVRNEKVLPLNRFVMACTFCCYDDALELWNSLSKLEEAFVRSSTILKPWTEWLESDSAKDRESFLAWSLETPLWHSNPFLLKHALQIISPAERSRFLLKVFSEDLIISNDVMLVFLLVMTENEQEIVFRKSIVQVFSCMLSWPLQTLFFEVTDYLWPFLTGETFCKVLQMILKTLSKRNDVELVIILKNLWALSPDHLKDATKVCDFCPQLFTILQIVLDSDVSIYFDNGRISYPFWRAVSHIVKYPHEVNRFKKLLESYKNW